MKEVTQQEVDKSFEEKIESLKPIILEFCKQIMQAQNDGKIFTGFSLNISNQCLCNLDVTFYDKELDALVDGQRFLLLK